MTRLTGSQLYALQPVNARADEELRNNKGGSNA
jgi:hypothetical protein